MCSLRHILKHLLFIAELHENIDGLKRENTVLVQSSSALQSEVESGRRALARSGEELTALSTELRTAREELKVM